MVFDIVEARHPCSGKPSVVEDIGLRLQEGLQELHLQEQLAPTREAISRTIATGSTSFFKAVEGVRGRWAQRSSSSLSVNDGALSTSSTPVDISRSEADLARTNAGDADGTRSQRSSTLSTSPHTGLRPLSLSTSPPIVASEAKQAIGSWGSSIGSFISQRTARLSVPRTNSTESAQSGSDNPGGTPPVEDKPAPKRSSGSSGMSESGAVATPLSGVFSSWSFGRASVVKPTEPAPSPGQTADVKGRQGNDEVLAFQPRDLGEFEPPRSPVQSISSSASVQHGMAL